MRGMQCSPIVELLTTSAYEMKLWLRQTVSAFNPSCLAPKKCRSAGIQRRYRDQYFNKKAQEKFLASFLLDNYHDLPGAL